MMTFRNAHHWASSQKYDRKVHLKKLYILRSCVFPSNKFASRPKTPNNIMNIKYIIIYLYPIYI